MEGEPVTRHYLNKLPDATACNKDLYCIFIAPTLNSNTIEEFAYYNTLRECKIVPITIKQFVTILNTKKECIKNQHPFSILSFRELLDTLISITQDTEVIDTNEDTKIILSNLDKAISTWCDNVLERS